MISESDKAVIEEVGRKYSVSRILLFGSSLSDRSAEDIDLAVEGLEPSVFFRFYSDLLFALSKPIDLLDLSRKKTRFGEMVLKEGVVLYG